ncbi:MAG: hypothetical protein Q9167_007974 [Letrouitia subvulpina]
MDYARFTALPNVITGFNHVPAVSLAPIVAYLESIHLSSQTFTALFSRVLIIPRSVDEMCLLVQVHPES